MPFPASHTGRRTPTYFTGSQREVLEVHYEYNNFPEPVEQLAIASQLGVDYPVVKTWFQNTRKNMRKQLKEEGEEGGRLREDEREEDGEEREIAEGGRGEGNS